MLAKILVVDDEQYILKLFEKILTKQGHEVQTAASVTEAISLLKKNDFDLIFSDLLMPDLGGMYLLKKVKAGCSDIPSGDSSDPGRKRYRQGVDLPAYPRPEQPER